ncbi:MAG: HAD family hydrolase, partial [Myxococcota bacterium]
PYLATAEALGVAADRCLALEDSLTGIRSAVAAGMTVVGVGAPATAGGLCAHSLSNFASVDAATLLRWQP